MDKDKITITIGEDTIPGRYVKYNTDFNDKHLKGYIFDSLVFRYQLARYAQADYEAKDKHESIKERRRYADRDIMRFIQILSEVIGEHG